MSSEGVCLEELRALHQRYDTGHAETLTEMRRMEDRLTNRLAEGTARMNVHDGRIRTLETDSDLHPALPDPHIKSKLPWWGVAMGTAIITLLTPQLWSAGIDLLFHLNHGVKL